MLECTRHGPQSTQQDVAARKQTQKIRRKKKEKKKKFSTEKRHQQCVIPLHFALETSKIRLSEKMKDMVAAQIESNATLSYRDNKFSLFVQFSNASASSARR